jgi:hypothetical protein
MTLAKEVGLANNRRILYTCALNRVENVRDRVEEISEFIELNDTLKACSVRGPPLDEEFGRRISQAIVSNHRIVGIVIAQNVLMRDMIPWIASRGTLQHMASLRTIGVLSSPNDTVQDLELFFRLLVTSTSLQMLVIRFENGCHDAFMRALSPFLLGGFSLTSLLLCHPPAAVLFSLCEFVAESSLRNLILMGRVARETNRDMVAERLALMIAASSSLEEVNVKVEEIDLLRTTPVRNLDFAFSQVGNDANHLKINRKWKPLLSANIPLGLWPHIFKKAHASPETSHGREGILFFLLKEQAGLIPRAGTSSRKRKRTD